MLFTPHIIWVQLFLSPPPPPNTPPGVVVRQFTTMCPNDSQEFTDAFALLRPSVSGQLFERDGGRSSPSFDGSGQLGANISGWSR